MAAVLLSILLDMDGSPWLVSQTWEIFVTGSVYAPWDLNPEPAD